MKDLSQEVIFGNDALKLLRIKLDYEFNTIKILSNKFRLENNKDTVGKITVCNTFKGDENNTDLKLAKLLKEYQNTVNVNSPIKGVKYKIPLLSTDIPNDKPFVEPAFKQKVLRDEIKRLLKKKIIRKSNSEFSAPCFTKKIARQHL